MLILPIKGKWFNMILSGDKQEEYREIKPYYTTTSEDLDFMNKELGRQAGAVFARILRAIKKMDFKEAQRVITGGKSR